MPNFIGHVQRRTVCLYGYLKDAVIVVIANPQQNESILSDMEEKLCEI